MSARAERADQVYEFIVEYVEHWQQVPRQKEIAAGCGLSLGHTAYAVAFLRGA